MAGKCTACGEPLASRAEQLCRQHYKRMLRRGVVIGPLPAPPFTHGTENGYTNRDCRCEDCKGWRKSKSVLERVLLGADPAYRSRASSASAKAQQIWNAETLPNAHRRGQQWTGPEMDVVLRAELTTRQKAAILGRSYMAVNTMLKRLRREPTLRRVVGLEPMR